MNSKRGYARLLVFAGVALALVLGAFPRYAGAAPASQGGSRTFPETKQTVSGRFLEVWSSLGSDANSLYINGYPITDKHAEVSLENGQVYQMQWFERARFEEHPENKAPYDVLLGRLGAYAAEGRSDAPFKTVANPGGGIQWFPETQHSVGDSSDGGKAIASFWGKYGGIAQFGYPLSQPFQEVTKSTDPAFAGKSFLVQYFERQRFEYHPENKGTQFEVLLGLLGVEQMGQTVKPATPISRPGNPADTLKLGRGQDPSTMLPYNDNTLIGTILRGFVFNGLTNRNSKAEVIPDLAMFVPTLENGGAYYVGTGDDKHLVIKYKLKPGLKWADGQPLNSNDVVFTYKLWLDPKFPAASRQAAQKISKISNPDPTTVIIELLTWKEAQALIARDADTYGFMSTFVESKSPITDPLYNELMGAILPEHVLGKMAPDQISESDYARTPMASGPYVVKSWSTGQDMTLEANPNYNVEVDKPVIKTIYSQIVSDNKQLPVGIDTGTFDVVTSESLTPDLLGTYKAVADKGKVKLYSLASAGYEHVDFHTQKAPFNVKEVRQALAYGIDRKAIGDALFAGAVAIPNSYIAATSWASIENPDVAKMFPDDAAKLIKYDYNPDKANQLLDAAGWKMGGDGIREKDGKKLQVRWLTTTKDYRKKDVLIIQQQLKKIGIDIVPDVQAAGQVFADPPDGPLYSGSYGDFGVVAFAWAFTTDEPAAVGTFDCSQVPSEANSNAGGNDVFYCNPDADKYARAAEAGLGHSKDRIANYVKHQIAINNDLPTLPLFNLPTIYLARADVQNFSPDAYLMTWNTQQWFMPK